MIFNNILNIQKDKIAKMNFYKNSICIMKIKMK